jgi:hypothetical protein
MVSKMQQIEYRPVTDFFSEQALRREVQLIVAAGGLGRSKVYPSLLRYLAEAALRGEQPKEIELATEVLGKDASFDVAADSSVRVTIYQLRKKLSAYYEQHPSGHCQLVIPKGQYTLVAESTGAGHHGSSRLRQFMTTLGHAPSLLTVCAALLAANLVFAFWGASWRDESRTYAAATHPVWESIVSDQRPILLVMGDYYIFGELNDNGNIARMVREFDVNSPNDLEELQFTDLARAEQYIDLNLSYMPEGSAYALAKIVPLLESQGKTVNVTMMSDLTTSDIHNNHIVYIGYISALDKLAQMTFVSSGLQLGRSYDELFDRHSLHYFTSDAGLPAAGEAFRDYGMISSFSASSETQIVIIAGMRDAGLMHTAKAVSDYSSLNDLVAALDEGSDSVSRSFEALYEVFGVDRLNFDANLVYSNTLDSKQIWTQTLKRSTRKL